MTSSIYPQIVTPNTPVIVADTDILSADIPITAEQVSPGKGGLLRLYFSLEFGVTPAIITVTNGGAVKGILNADNAGAIITDGIYRFDIDVEAGDAINFQADQSVTTIRFIRAHLVQFGA